MITTPIQINQINFAVFDSTFKSKIKTRNTIYESGRKNHHFFQIADLTFSCIIIQIFQEFKPFSLDVYLSNKRDSLVTASQEIPYANNTATKIEISRYKLAQIICKVEQQKNSLTYG